jgi:hypothetical protein
MHPSPEVHPSPVVLVSGGLIRIDCACGTIELVPRNVGGALAAMLDAHPHLDGLVDSGRVGLDGDEPPGVAFPVTFIRGSGRG